ncbi:hypothetical protein PCL_12949 [Purpureocillium lilacinum]|uniref:Uncharacterized protein n=1 Tax=Purpureocillium lilacinum TaxID=33203 RepID=A0A2U3E7Q7_PURLI|nr:hypothetical protein PCL_12949 [Purpureocillium lilacinum]
MGECVYKCLVVVIVEEVASESTTANAAALRDPSKYSNRETDSLQVGGFSSWEPSICMTDGAAVWDTETGLCLHTQTVQTRFEGTCTQHRPMNRKGVDLQGNDFWPVASATSRTQTITQPLSILSFPAPLTSHPYGYKTAQRVHQVPHPSHRDFGRPGSHFQDSTQSNVNSSTSRKTCANEEYTTATHYLREPAKAEHEAEAGMRSQDTALSTRKQIQERQEGEPITSKTGARVPPSR